MSNEPIRGRVGMADKPVLETGAFGVRVQVPSPAWNKRPPLCGLFAIRGDLNPKAENKRRRVDFGFGTASPPASIILGNTVYCRRLFHCRQCRCFAKTCCRQE